MIPIVIGALGIVPESWERSLEELEIGERKERQVFGTWQRIKKLKLKNKRLTVIPIVIGAPGMVPESWERSLEELEIGGRIQAIQTIAMIDQNT